MNTKLTLTIEKDIIERAKSYAREKNRSLSDLIENYLKSLTANIEQDNVQDLNPLVASLKGSFKMPKDMDYKKELRNRIEKKVLQGMNSHYKKTDNGKGSIFVCLIKQ